MAADERAQHLRGHLVDAGRRRRRRLAELVEPAGHGRLGAGDLDRADGAEHVADEPGDRGRGLALAPAPRPQPVAEHAAEHQGEQHRHHHDDRHPHVDGRHDEHREAAGDRDAGHVEPHVEHHRQVHGVVAEAADGLAAASWAAARRRGPGRRRASAAC